MSNDSIVQRNEQGDLDSKIWVQVLSIFFISGVLITLVGGMLAFAWFITIFLAWFIIPAGFAYFIVVAIVASIQRSRAKKDLSRGVPDFTLKQIEASEFKAASQVASLAMNIYLSLIAVLVPILHFSTTSTSVSDSFSFILFVLGGALLVAALYVPFVNAPGIYKRQFLQAEAYALQNKTLNYKWIRLNRVWSWIIWFIYGVGVPVISFLFLQGVVSSFDV